MRTGAGLNIGVRGGVRWNPLSRKSALRGWWKGEATLDASGITIATGASQWKDASGQSNHVIQNTGSLQPATAKIAGKYVLRFSAAAKQWMSRDSSAAGSGTFTGGAVAQPTTWYGVLKASSSTAADFAVFDGQAIRQLATIRPVAGTSGMFAGSGPFYGGSGNNAGILHVYCWQFNGASSRFYIDNMVTPIATLSVGTNSINGVLIGALAGGTVYNFDGDMCELALFAGADDETARNQMKYYLKARWGTP